MKHQIVGLCEARVLSARPKSIPIGRARGAKAFGVRYEKALAKILPQSALRGAWYEYVDKLGHGYCQTDFEILGNSGALAVLECKYTWTEDGHVELEKLYSPVVRLARKCEVLPIVVCKKLIPAMRGVKICADLGSALRASKNGHRVVWHWIGGYVPDHENEVIPFGAKFGLDSSSAHV